MPRGLAGLVVADDVELAVVVRDEQHGVGVLGIAVGVYRPSRVEADSADFEEVVSIEVA